VLELRRSQFEEQWRSRQEVLTSCKKVNEFRKETQEIKKQITETSHQIVDIRTQAGESLTASKVACDNFKQFTRVIESLELRVIKLKNTGEKLQEECPEEAPRIRNDVREVEVLWNDVKSQVEDTEEILDKNVTYLELVEEVSNKCFNCFA